MNVKGLVALLFVAVVAGLLGVVPSAEADGHTLTNDCIDSVPEPDGTPVRICYSLYQPAGADASNPVPLIFHSHGWGGSRTNSATAFGSWLDAGFGVLSFDQRSFGESGGKAHVENPDYEGQDVQGLVDVVAGLDWVVQDGPGDPRIGAIGGSYGGGYQFVGAFTDVLETGSSRFDALAPEITWWDLKESLAPASVPRSAWTTALYAVGADSHTDTVHKGFVYGATTGEWPATGEPGVAELDADLDTFFEKNGPRWHVENGRQLDIPVLFGQGLSDNLFNVNQGIKNFRNALTDGARAESIFVGYNGGHALPNVMPPASFPGGDPCSTVIGGGSFGDLSLDFFRKHLKGEAVPALDAYEGTYNLATNGGACLSGLASIDDTTTYSLGLPVVTPTGPGGPIHLELTQGPVTVAGIPEVTADVTPLGADARAFFALSVGASPADAQVVQANMLPIHEHGTLPGTTNARSIELPGVAVDVPAGQSLFLTVSAFSDMSFGHGSKTPGGLLLENVQVLVPTR